MRDTTSTVTEEGELAGSVKTYDHYDRVIEDKYFDINGDPAQGEEKCAAVQREYTSRNQVSLVRYFDGEGNGTKVNGVYGVKRVYNSYNNLESETSLDAEGNPATNDEGFATTVYDYDLSNSNRVEKYFMYYMDAQGVPTAAKNGAFGYTMLYYPVTRIRVITYIDQNGQPMTIDAGYAILEYENDEAGNCVWESYYDDSHIAVEGPDGYAGVERSYDSEGRLIGERYVDRFNKLTNNQNGVAGWNGYYDEQGNLVITSRYDQNRMLLGD
jgi:hypothetical protein